MCVCVIVVVLCVVCVCGYVSGEREGGYKSHHGFNGFTRNAEIERGGSNECVGVEMMV